MNPLSYHLWNPVGGFLRDDDWRKVGVFVLFGCDFDDSSRVFVFSGGRSFGLDQRLIIPSRSVASDFKMLPFPHRVGDPLPVVTWNEDRTKLTITIGQQSDTVTFARNAAGRNELAIARGGEKPVRLNP